MNVAGEDRFMRIILDAVRNEVDAQIEREIEAASERIKKAFRAGAARIALEVLSQYSVVRNGPEIVIRVKTDGAT